MSATQLIGPYEVIEQVGSGGMATVYKAHQPRLGRYVAIKVMHQMFSQDSSFLARFEREARIVARLDHPNIVPIYDYDEYNGQPYLVMKCIDGKTLKDVLREGTLPLEDIRRMMHNVADALTYAHQQGVLHRDIKPSNIIIDNQGIPYLTDFGLARIAVQGESTMSADIMLGTPQYISPEQAQGLPDLDARTDVYSLGCILYELVAGRVPFVGDSPYSIVHKHIYAAPLPPSQLNPEVPASVDAVLLRALAKEPEERYATPNDLVQEFERAITTSGLTQLDEDRVQTAAALGADLSYQTPRGSKYVSIPAAITGAAPPPTSVNQVMQDIGDRFRDAFVEVRRELEQRGVIDKIASGVREVANEIQMNISAAQAGDGAGKGIEAVRRRKTVKIINDDWGMDEESIRRRVNKRIQERQGLFVHGLIYTVVIASLAATQGVVQPALQQALTSPEVAAEVGGAFLAPLTQLNYVLVTALAWGTGLAGHALSVFYNSGGRLERKRRVMQREFEAYHGMNWREQIDARDYKRIRRRVEDRFKKRVGLISHFVSFLLLTLMIVVAWPPIYQTILAIPDLPIEMLPFLANENTIPLLISLFLGVSVLLHGLVLGLASVLGGDISAQAILKEVERERELSGIGAAYAEKPKHEMMSGDVIQYEKRKHDEGDDLAPRVSDRVPAIRLTGDGEFTESFISELEEKERRERRD